MLTLNMHEIWGEIGPEVDPSKIFLFRGQERAKKGPKMRNSYRFLVSHFSHFKSCEKISRNTCLVSREMRDHLPALSLGIWQSIGLIGLFGKVLCKVKLDDYEED